MTPTPAERVRFRALAERALRDVLAKRGLVEAHVPVIVPNPGFEPHLTAFRVSAREAKALDGHYLHTSPEYALKAVLAELGMDVFTLTRTFRDEPRSPWHIPEFTMLEWYRLHADWELAIEDTETIVREVVCAAVGADSLTADLLARPFERMRVRDAFIQWVGVEPDAPDDALRDALRRRDVSHGDDWDWESLFSIAIVECIEPAISARPTFLTHYPVRAAALSRVAPNEPTAAERFELYLPRREGGVELANGYGELVDPAEQRSRFAADLDARKRSGADVYPYPDAMLRGLGEIDRAAGVALGWERLLSWTAEHALGWRADVADWLLGW